MLCSGNGLEREAAENEPLSTYMGHASVMIILDRYGHLMPSNEEQAAGLLDELSGSECLCVVVGGADEAWND